MFPDSGRLTMGSQWWCSFQAHGTERDIDSEIDMLNTVHAWDLAVSKSQGEQHQKDSSTNFETTVRLRSLWAGLRRPVCQPTKRRRAPVSREASPDQTSRRTRRRMTNMECKITALAPAHAALILANLPIEHILRMRQTCKYFVDACRSVYSLDLGDLPMEWSVGTIKQHLLSCFGTPLTLENVRSSRSMKLRDLHALVDSGDLRIRSLTLGPNCHIGRVRAKRVAGLVTDGMLQSLDLGGSGCLRSAGAFSLADSLTGSPRTLSSLQHLNLRACRIGVEGAAAVARLMGSEDCGLLSLCLQDNALGSEGATAIARALAGGGVQRLQNLNLTLNHLRTEGAAVIAQAISACPSLVNVNLSWNLIRSGAAEALATAVTMAGLTTLDLGFNLIRCSGAAQLASGVASCSTLQVLSLRRNELAAEGATQLARALFTNTSLHTLDLGLNGIGPAGARLLGSALGRNSTLRHLDLDWNALRQQGIQHLAPGLRLNQGLTHLDLSCNKLLQDGAFALATALAGRHSERLGREVSVRYMTTMKGLLLRGNGIGPWGLSSLMPLLGRGHDGELDLSDNSLGDSGCMLLANEGHALLMEVTSLNLSGNAMSLEGLTALTKVLAKSTRLAELKLARNNITSLPPALVEMPALASLSVHDNPLEDPPAHVLQGGYRAVSAYLRRGLAHERKGKCSCCGLVMCLGEGDAVGDKGGHDLQKEGDMRMEDDDGDVVLVSQAERDRVVLPQDGGVGVDHRGLLGQERVRARPRGAGGRGGCPGMDDMSDSHWEEECGGALATQLSDEELEAARTQEARRCFGLK